MAETVAEMTDERLIEHITGMVAVGWRKGVDGEGCAKIYNTLNGGFFKSDPRIQEMSEANVVAIAIAAAPLIRTNAPSKEIGAAIKEAACQLVPLPEGTKEVKLTADGAGVAMLRALAPVEYEFHGKNRIIVLPTDKHNRSEMREQCERYNKDKKPDYEYHEDEHWENRGYFGEEKQMYCGAVLCKLVEEIPAVREYFADVLNQDYVTQFRYQLQEANREVTDTGWQCLANYFKYCLDMKEDWD